MTVKPYQSMLVKIWNSSTNIFPNQLSTSTLSVDNILKTAQKKAQRKVSGKITFIEPLTQLVNAINETGNLHSFGRFYIKQMLIGLVVNRLELEALWEQHPEILEIPIEKPIFILGLPRTGTSFLFNLMALNSEHHFLTNWETTVSQRPPAGKYSFKNDPRRKQGKWMLRFQHYLAPHMDEIHRFYLDGPEECTPLLFQEFSTLALASLFDVPTYSDWLNNKSHTTTYQHHKRILQTLQWKYPNKRWLLKSPAHIEGITDILKVYPDACLIHMHRDPSQSIPSYASLSATFRGIYSISLNYKSIGQQVLDRLATDMNYFIKHQNNTEKLKSIDLQYIDLVAEPLETIKKIYSHFDLAFSDTIEDQLQVYLTSKQGKKQSHNYDLESFGYTKEIIRQRFANYIQYFSVQVEN